ncbi:MAG: 8-amino-7-oxononanoate synthase [Candidatus Gastranaerophilales bacterium]|nr:8-amino-7-oxononanoate synthase [Candidatus Gastranaerophilales bacterium]
MESLFKRKLFDLKLKNNYRKLSDVKGIDFSSNDYLGLANHPRIKEAIVKALQKGLSIGSSGSRLLTGNIKEFQILEEFAASYFSAESCLFFSSGFIANYALFTTLPQRHDVILYDEFAHASIREGIRASLAKSIKFKHNDLISLKTAIEKAASLSAKTIWISIESVYSMDGDIADINDILRLIKNYPNTYLVVDEAHSTGIFGINGKGFTYNLDYENLITLHTCGKALGVSGALVCASQDIIEYLINKARPFIYTTAESPIIAVAVQESLLILQEEVWRKEKLLELISYVHKNYSVNLNAKTQIIPIILDDELTATNAAVALQDKGFDVRAIRPPTVAVSRLRISLNTNRTKEEVDDLFENVNLILRDLK